MGIPLSPSVQSPKAYDLKNLQGGQLAARMSEAQILGRLTGPGVSGTLATGVTAAVRANLRTALQDGAYLYKIHAAETAAGLVDANLTFGFQPGDARRYGAVGDDATLNGTALTRWLTVLGQASNEFEGFLPAGKFRCESTLTIPANAVISGVMNQTSILKPTAAIGANAFLTTSNGVKLRSLCIDGVLTAKATGLLVGPVGPDYNELRDVWVQNFIGATAGTAGYGVGIIVVNVVSLLALRLFAIACNTGLVVQSPTPQSLPTTCLFESCRFRTCILVPTSLTQTGDGVRVLSGQQVTFRDCIIEYNQAHGMFVQATNTGGVGIVQDLKVQDTWFEGNYDAHVDTGTNVYSLYVDGTTAGGVSIILSNVHLSQGGVLSDRKSILLASCVATLENIRCFYGFAHEVVITGGGASLTYLKDDGADRCGRFLDNAGNAQSVSSPLYLPIIDLGTGFSALPTIEKLVGLTYSASMTPDLKDGNSFTVQVSNTNAFAINAPLHAAGVQIGKRLSIRLNNVSGNNVLGAATWNAVFKLAAWVNPSNNFYHNIEFEWDGANWREVSRATTQVPV